MAINNHMRGNQNKKDTLKFIKRLKSSKKAANPEQHFIMFSDM